MTQLQNLWTDPRCMEPPTALYRVSCTLVDNGGWQLTVGDDAYGTASLSTALTPLGSIIFGQLSDPIPGVEASNRVWSSSDGLLIAYKVATDGNRGFRVSSGQTVTIHRVGVYSEDDWQRLLTMYEDGDISIPWFSYDSMPLS